MEAGLLLLREFLRAHPPEAASELERIDGEEAAAVLADASPEHAAPVLAHMGAMAAAEALEHMEVPSATALICRVESPLAAMLLRRVTLPARQNILFVCPEPWKSSIETALAKPAGSVAGFMDNRAPVFPIDWKVSELVQYLTAHPARMALDVFVADREHKLVGRIELRTLEGRLNVRELRGAMAPTPPSLPLRTAIRTIREDALWRRFDVLPVVDESGVFAGALAHRTLRMADDPAAAREAASAGGVFIDFAELAWTGYVSAIDVASSLTRSLTNPEEPGRGQKD